MKRGLLLVTPKTALVRGPVDTDSTKQFSAKESKLQTSALAFRLCTLL